MKQRYIITLFLLPFWCFSQLHIQPNGNQDTYVYVEGALLFVEKDIHLKANPSPENLAGLYLRDQGQLIQGDENAVNTGTGQLSIFQEGKANAYTYNYWGSPVQSAIAQQAIGNIIQEPLGKIQSRPAQVTQELNGRASPLTISGRWIYKLSGRDYSDWEYIGNTFDLNPGEGFTMKGVEGLNTDVVLYGVANNPGNEQRYDFRGIPNTGTIALDIKKDKILLVGNPYPSAIDLNRFLIENTNSTGIAYFWDSKPVNSHYLTDYEGGYGAYSPVLGSNGYVPAVFHKYDAEGSSIGQTGQTGNIYARQYSPVAQGFLIEGLKDGKVFFRNKFRSFIKENSQTSQFKSPAQTKSVNADIAYARINIEFNNQYIRQLLLAFHPRATTGVDRAMDAKNLMPLDTDAGWHLEGAKYLTHVRPVDKKDLIPLAISASGESLVELSIAELYNLPGDLYLYDSEIGIYYNLKNQEVRLQLPAGKFDQRFKITFDKKEINESIMPDEYYEYAILQNNKLQRAEILSPAFAAPDQIVLYDSSGRKISSIKGEKNQTYHEISTGKLAKGMYIIKIITPNATVISKKVIISN